MELAVLEEDADHGPAEVDERQQRRHRQREHRGQGLPQGAAQRPPLQGGGMRGQAREGRLPHGLAQQRDRQAHQQPGVVDGGQPGALRRRGSERRINDEPNIGDADGEAIGDQ